MTNPMRVGLTFPQREMMPDRGSVKEFVQAAEDLGYDHIVCADHVLGADPAHHPFLNDRPYSHESIVHEAFMLLSFVAGLSSKLGLLTGVLILPQRQTALVAKQADELDFISDGKFRLGVGTGWNHVEYEALNENFRDRGRRSEEQIELMRELWTQETADFSGRHDRVRHAGVNPLPVQRPIPVWLGGGRNAEPGNAAERVVERVGRMADGWLPQFPTDDSGMAILERMRQYARDAGRDPSEIGIEGRIRVAGKGPEEWALEAGWWKDAGATHINVDTRWSEMPRPEQHIDVARQFKEAIAGLQ